MWRNLVNLRWISWILLLALPTLTTAETIRNGQLAPEFILYSLEGDKFELKSYRGKNAVYLVFWNSWCPSCGRKAPEIEAMYQRYKDRLTILGINTSWDDSIAEMKKFRKKYAVNFPLAYDKDGVISDLYGVEGTPTGFLIDIDGYVRQVDGIPESIADRLNDWNTNKRTMDGGCGKRVPC